MLLLRHLYLQLHVQGNRRNQVCMLMFFVNHALKGRKALHPQPDLTFKLAHEHDFLSHLSRRWR